MPARKDLPLVMTKSGKSMTAVQVAQGLMKKRGKVVIGIKPNKKVPQLLEGDIVNEFACSPIPGYSLKVASKTTREDWDEQLSTIFGDTFKDPNAHTSETLYYECVLIERY